MTSSSSHPSHTDSGQDDVTKDEKEEEEEDDDDVMEEDDDDDVMEEDNDYNDVIMDEDERERMWEEVWDVCLSMTSSLSLLPPSSASENILRVVVGEVR